MSEADAGLVELEGLIRRINRTNSVAKIDTDVTLTDAIARRDVLRLRRSLYVAAADAATGHVESHPGPGDYNGDGKTDYAIYRPSTGGWEVAGITSGVWGLPDDAPLPLPYAIANTFFPPPTP